MKKTVLITGASSGIGREFARLYAKEGHDLILVSRSKQSLGELKHELEKAHLIQAVVIAQDLSAASSAEILYKKVKEAKGNVDILINNAGFGDFGEIVEQQPARVEAMLGLNVLTLTKLCILFGNEFKKRRAGGIINVASVAGFQPIPYFATYSASKAYVLSFTEALAKEMEDYNVAVTCLCPGGTKTDFFSTAGHAEITKEDRMMDASTVAMIGKQALESHRMTIICGLNNAIRSNLVRFFPRSTVASITKKMFLSYK